ncbi:hypothetical protein N665_1160s0011 [Sinapis alba]|nr:hypothetical protein N665_1160s0011 [Sinapis alba]
MASKTTLFILFALFLSCMLLVSVEAQLIIPCKTAADCKSKIYCSNGSPQCVVRQCQCASVKPVNLMRTNTPVRQ